LIIGDLTAPDQHVWVTSERGGEPLLEHGRIRA
jgi:hypothetical protein